LPRLVSTTPRLMQPMFSTSAPGCLRVMRVPLQLGGRALGRQAALGIRRATTDAAGNKTVSKPGIFCSNLIASQFRKSRVPFLTLAVVSVNPVQLWFNNLLKAWKNSSTDDKWRKVAPHLSQNEPLHPVSGLSNYAKSDSSL